MGRNTGNRQGSSSRVTLIAISYYRDKRFPRDGDEISERKEGSSRVFVPCEKEQLEKNQATVVLFSGRGKYVRHTGPISNLPRELREKIEAFERGRRR